MATNLIAFRGRNDDGNESGATWKAAQNTRWNQAKDQNFRVRFLHQQSGSLINNLDIQLQYQRNGGGWNNVTASSTVVRSSASANLADAANLTSQLTGGSGTFQGATGFDEVNGICGGNSMDVAATGQFETEFSVQLRSADVVDGDLIELRTINSDTGTPWETYTAVASFYATAPPAITGTLNRTLDAATLAAAGMVFGPHSVTDVSVLSAGYLPGRIYGSFDHTPPGVTATLNQTLAALTRDIAAAVAIAASANRTLDALTASGAAKVEVKGTASEELGALTAASQATVPVLASLAKSLGDMTGGGNGQVACTAALSKILGALVSTAEAKVAVAASLSKTLADVTIQATSGEARTQVSVMSAGYMPGRLYGTFTPRQAAILGSLNQTLGTLIADADAAVALAASVARTLDALTFKRGYILQEDETSRIEREEGGGFLLQEHGSARATVASVGRDITDLTVLAASYSPGRLYGTFTRAAAIIATLSKTLSDAVLTASGDVEARGSVSKTLAALASSSAVGVDVKASLSKALDSLGRQLAGTIGVKAGVDKVLGALSSASAVDVLAEGSLDRVLDSLTGSATGTAGISGTVNKSLAGAMLSSAADVEVEAAFSKALGALVAASAADVEVRASLNKSLAPATISAFASGGGRQASLNKTLDALGASITATVAIAGNVNKQLGALTSAGAGDVGISGAVSNQLGALTGTGAVDVEVKGATTRTLDALARSISGTVAILGSVSRTLANATLQASAVVDNPPIIANLNRTLAPLTGAATADVNIRAELQKALDSLSASITAEVDTTGSLSKTLAGLAATLTGGVEVKAALTRTLADIAVIPRRAGTVTIRERRISSVYISESRHNSIYSSVQ